MLDMCLCKPSSSRHASWLDFHLLHNILPTYELGRWLFVWIKGVYTKVKSGKSCTTFEAVWFQGFGNTTKWLDPWALQPTSDETHHLCD